MEATWRWLRSCRFAGDQSAAVELKKEAIATGRANPNAVIRRCPDRASNGGDPERPELHGVAAGRIEQSARVRGGGACPTARAWPVARDRARAARRRDGRVPRTRRQPCVRALRRSGSRRGRRPVPGGRVEARLGQAECELLLGRPEQAEALLRTATAVLSGLGRTLELELQAIRVAAMLAAAGGEAERSAVLFGVARSKLQEAGITLFSTLEDEVLGIPISGVRAGISVKHGSTLRSSVVCGQSTSRLPVAFTT